MGDNIKAQIGPGGQIEIVRTKPEVDSQTRQWQLSGFDIIEELRHRLKGEIPKDNPQIQSIEWITIGEPLANDNGINEMCMFLSNYINKNIQLSWFSPEQIDIILIDFEKSLTRKLENDYKRLGVRKEDVDTVFLMLSNTVWAAINRARFGGEKQFIEGTEERRIISTESGQGNQSKSWFDRLPLIGK